jgi:hypothetical protein
MSMSPDLEWPGWRASQRCAICGVPIHKVVEDHWTGWQDDDDDQLSYAPVLHDHTPEEQVMPTYKIVRFYFKDSEENETIVRGLTLEQAQAHCSRDDTSGDGWFDGYEEET